MRLLKNDYRTDANSCRSTDQSYKQNDGDRRLTLSVFGEKARQIQEGQIFIARKVIITEGDKMVLEPVFTINAEGEKVFEVRYE